MTNPTNEGMPEPTTREVRLLLDACFYYMGQEMRGHLIRELPQAYNRYVGRQVAVVTHSSDGRVA